MRLKTFAALALTPLFFASCIQDEEPNTECDIEAVALHLTSPSSCFFHDYDTLKTVIPADSIIVFTIRSYADVGLVPLSLRTTPGATVYLLKEDGSEELFQNGSLVDFSNEEIRWFRTVSEDKKWSRSYRIQVRHDKPSEGNLSFDFEDYRLDATSKYYEWPATEVFTDAMWKNGNPGFKISKSSAQPMEYPSTPVVGGGPDGSNCVKLETCDTGPFGKMVNMRLASGSMFNGIFDVSNAIKDALKATLMGSPFTHKPEQLRIWLRYEPGSFFQDRSAKPVEGIVDEPDVYVVLYRNEDPLGNKVQIDGGDVMTNPFIVGKGRLPHHLNADGSDQLSGNPIHGLTSEWQEIIIPVVYTEEVDETILKDKGYNLLISIASSWQGGYFQGAVGSKLFIDKLRLFCD